MRDKNGRMVCRRLRVADSMISRMRGLLGRKELPADEGLLLTPCSSIHMWFMRFPLDVVFLQSDLTILKVKEHVGPWRVVSCSGARSVLELPAGACAEKGLRPGDRLALDELEKEQADVMLLMRRGDETQVVVGRGPLSAATRTIAAMGELDVGVSAVVLGGDEPPPK
jgi:hypothetical protein